MSLPLIMLASVCALLPAQSQENAALTLTELQSITPLVLVGSDGGKRNIAAGTAFVVSKSGLLATAYHVVSHAVMYPEKYKVYLSLAGHTIIPTSLVGIDIMNDVALLRVDHAFPREFKLSRMPAFQGQHLSSIGYANSDFTSSQFSRMDGKYLERLRGINFSGFGSTTSVTPGMSGGPILDIHDEVVGVNCQGYKDPKHWSLIGSAVENIVRLIERAKSSKEDFSSNNVQVIAETQLLDAEYRLLEDWRKNHSDDRLLSHWVLTTHGSALICNLEQTNALSWKPATGLDFVREYCVWPVLNPTASYVRKASRYSVEYRTMTNHTFRYSDFLSHVKSNNDWALEPEKSADVPGAKDDTTTYKCTSTERTLLSGLPIQFTKCVRPYTQFPQLWDAYAKFYTTIPEGAEQLLGNISLLSFRREHIDEIVESWLAGISEKKQSNNAAAKISK